jgi:hypothetical protein
MQLNAVENAMNRLTNLSINFNKHVVKRNRNVAVIIRTMGSGTNHSLI